INEGHFGSHLRKMRALYTTRRDALVKTIRQHLSRHLTLCNTDAGLHLAAYLPRRFNDLEIVRRAAEQGITATPLSSCYAGTAKRSGLILGFGGADERQIARAGKSLGTLLDRMAAE